MIKCGNYKVCKFRFQVIYSCFLLLFHYLYGRGLLSLWSNRYYSSLGASCLHLLVPHRQIQDTKGYLVQQIILHIAVVISWVVFLLVLIFMQKFIRYLCLTKSIVLPFSAPSSGNNWAKNKLIPRAFSVTVIFSGNSFCTVDAIFLDIANIFQIWSMLAGYQEFA